METRYSFGGDDHIFVEVDEAMSLDAFFKSLSMTNAVRESGIKGVTEICPANASYQIRFDPDLISPNDMLAELKRLESAAGQSDRMLSTRILEVPVYYNDPWTHETLMRFRERHQERLEPTSNTPRASTVMPASQISSRRIQAPRGSSRWLASSPGCRSCINGRAGEAD